MATRIIKVTITKPTLAPRRAMMAYLDTIDRLVAMPTPRCARDAERMARTYLHHYRQHLDPVACETRNHILFGREHLFDLDIRRLVYALLEEDAEPLWPGILVALLYPPALEQVRKLDTLLTAGTLRIEVLTLAGSENNSAVIADALGDHYAAALTTLLCRLEGRKPNVAEIEAIYRRLCLRIRKAEEWLGMPLLCLSEQVACEAALAQVAHAGGRVET